MIDKLNHRIAGDSYTSLALVAAFADILAMADDDGFRERWWAVDPRNNIARDYELSMSTDLFGWTIVERRWGRIGTKGQARCSSFAERTDALRLVAAVRRRRASAQKRLGVPYTPVQA